MSGVGFWWRRMWLLGPFFLVLYAVNMARFSRDFRDWSMMLDTVAGSTMLVGPMVAAAVGSGVYRSWPEGAREVGKTLPRPHQPLIEISLAVLLWAWVVHGVVLALGSLLCLLNNAYAESLTLPWQVLTGPLALLASGTLGMLMIQLIPRLYVIPLVAVAIYAVEIVFFAVGLPQVLTVIQPGMSMRPMRLAWSHLAVQMAANCSMSAIFASAAFWCSQPRARRQHLWLVTGACGVVALVIVMYVWTSLPPDRYVY